MRRLRMCAALLVVAMVMLVPAAPAMAGNGNIGKHATGARRKLSALWASSLTVRSDKRVVALASGSASAATSWTRPAFGSPMSPTARE